MSKGDKLMIQKIKIHFSAYHLGKFDTIIEDSHYRSYVYFYISPNDQEELNEQAISYFVWYEKHYQVKIQIDALEKIKSDYDELKDRIIEDLKL